MVAVVYLMQGLPLPENLACVRARQPRQQTEKRCLPAPLLPVICTHSPAFSVNDKPLNKVRSSRSKSTLGFKHTHAITLLKTWPTSRISAACALSLYGNQYRFAHLSPPCYASSRQPISGRLYPYTRSCDSYGTPASYCPSCAATHSVPSSDDELRIPRRVNNAKNFTIQLFTCFELAYHLRHKLVRNVTIRTGRTDAATVVVVHGIMYS